MSEEWGPGVPDSPVSPAERRQEREEEEEDPNPSEEQETEQEAAPSAHEQIRAKDQREDHEREKWHKGSVDNLLERYRGEYAFLPVFGFNEGHVAVRRYAERRQLDEDEFWKEKAPLGKMFPDEVAEEDPTKIAGKELSWWETDSIMPQHPFMLINPVGFTTADADENDFRDLFRTQKGEHFVFSDSGGYQLMSMDDAEIVDSRDEHGFQDLNVYPERLVEWQVTNADAGATIDFPPYNISGDANFPDAVEHTEDWKVFYEQRRMKSIEMAARMESRLLELREDGNEEAEDYIFAPVIHGKPHPNSRQQYISRWHGGLLKAMETWPRGWVLKPEPSHSYGQIALHLGYAADCLLPNEKGDRPTEFIHVLMVGGLLQKTLLMYFAQKSDVLVTSDASSYAAGGKRRQFDLPKTARRRSVIISNRSDEEREDSTVDANRLDRYPCRCQVCSTVEREYGFEFVTGGTGSARNASLNLHNLHQALSIEQTLDALLREEGEEVVGVRGEPTSSEFWRFVSTITSEKKKRDLYRAMDYVRLAIEEGLDEANSNYYIPWDGSAGHTVQRISGAADW